MKKDLSPSDIEKRLKNAYDSGKKDGFVEGADITHKIWVHTAPKTKGIGPVTYKKLMEEMTAEMKRRLKRPDIVEIALQDCIVIPRDVATEIVELLKAHEHPYTKDMEVKLDG